MLPISSMIPNHHRPPGRDRSPRNSEQPPHYLNFFPSSRGQAVTDRCPAPEVSPTRPDARRVRLSACRPCSIQMTTVGDGRDHEGHDEQHRQDYGPRREDPPPRAVHRVTARCSKAVSASRQRPYQTQAAHAAAAPASSNADSVRGLSPRERLLFIGQSFPRSWGRTIGRNQSQLCDPTAGVRPVKTFTRARARSRLPPSAFRRRSVGSSNRPTVAE